MSEQLLRGGVVEGMGVDTLEAPTVLELVAAVDEALAEVDAAVTAGELRVSAATLDERVPQKAGPGNDSDGRHTNW